MLASIYQFSQQVMKKKSLKENGNLVSICTSKYSETSTVFNIHFQQSFLCERQMKTNDNNTAPSLHKFKICHFDNLTLIGQ